MLPTPEPPPLWLEPGPELLDVLAGDGMSAIGDGVTANLGWDKEGGHFNRRCFYMWGQRSKLIIGDSLCSADRSLMWRLGRIMEQKNKVLLRPRVLSLFYLSNECVISIISKLQLVLTVKCSARVFEYLRAVLYLCRNMAICRSDWHFKLQDTDTVHTIINIQEN